MQIQPNSEQSMKAGIFIKSILLLVVVAAGVYLVKPELVEDCLSGLGTDKKYTQKRSRKAKKNRKAKKDAALALAGEAAPAAAEDAPDDEGKGCDVHFSVSGDHSGP